MLLKNYGLNPDITDFFNTHIDPFEEKNVGPYLANFLYSFGTL
jgi:hypothetical protein